MDYNEIKKQILDQNRLHLFTSENDNSYLYDALSQNIFPVEDYTAKYLFSDKDFNELPDESQPIRICQKLSNYTGKFNFVRLPETHLTINFSNKCNLNCTYCYRNKASKTVIDLDKVYDILEYADKYYKANNDEIIFSIDLTAEAFLDADKIIALDDKFAEYEDLYIKEEEIIKGTFAEFYELLKKDLYKEENLPEDVKTGLDKIILDGNLYSLFADKEKVAQILEKGHYDPAFLDKKRLLRLNRELLEVFYPEYLKHREYQEYRLWFMSNGTHITEKEIELVKKIRIDPFWVSIDGPEDVHNKNRMYYDGKGSFKDVIKNIQYMQDNGLNVKVSCVLTSDYPYADKLFEYLKSINPRGGIQICPVRNGCSNSINNETLEELKQSYKRLYNKLFDEIKAGDFSSLPLLTEDLSMVAITSLFSRGRNTGRCTWGSEVILDSKGDMYPCLYVIGNKDYLIGNIDEKKNCTELLKPVPVDGIKECSKCWARYLCGGTCHYNSIVSKGNIFEADTFECEIRKFVISESIAFLIRLLENGIDINTIVKYLR